MATITSTTVVECKDQADFDAVLAHLGRTGVSVESPGRFASRVDTPQSLYVTLVESRVETAGGWT